MRTLRSVYGIMIAMSLGACLHPPAPVGPVPAGVDAERYGVLQHAAGMATGCPLTQLEYRKEDGRDVFAGCGKLAMYEVFEPNTPTCQALGEWDAKQWCYESVPLEEAQFDLHCQRADLTLTRLGPLVYGASGCGGRVRYQYVSARWLADVAASQNP